MQQPRFSMAIILLETFILEQKNSVICVFVCASWDFSVDISRTEQNKYCIQNVNNKLKWFYRMCEFCCCACWLFCFMLTVYVYFVVCRSWHTDCERNQVSLLVAKQPIPIVSNWTIFLTGTTPSMWFCKNALCVYDLFATICHHTLP